MPIRLTCPACSATLSVKDEYAGRAVKCPKCGGVIPASAQAPAASAAPPPAAPPPPPPAKSTPAPAPEPEPAAEKSPFEDLDAPKSKDKKKSVWDDEDEDKPKKKKRAEEEDDRPKKKNRDEEEDEDKPKKKQRDEDDSDEKSAKKKDKGKRRDDDDDDGDGRGKKKEKKGGGGGGTVLIIVGVVLLLCCGGGGGLGYYIYTSIRDKAKEVADNLEKWNPSVSKFSYDLLTVGTTTRTDTEAILGKGKAPTKDDLAKIFGSDKSSADSWNAMVTKNRVLMWQNNDDYILCAFHPSSDATARLQMKEWKPKTPPGKSEGSGDDAAFLQKYPVGGKGGPGGAAVDVSAETLAQDYKDDGNAADAKYMGKELTVEGKLGDVAVDFTDDLLVRLTVPGKPSVRCAVAKADAKEVWKTSRTQTIKLRGKCTGRTGDIIDLIDCKYVSRQTPDPVTSITASGFLDEYRLVPNGAESKYKDKPITITSARVVSKTGTSVTLSSSGKAKDNYRIKANLPADYSKQLDGINVNEVISIKGEVSLFSDADKTVDINRAWIVPK